METENDTKKIAASIINTWAGDLLKARDNNQIPEFVSTYYGSKSFFKPTLDAFVKDKEDVVGYFESFSKDLNDMINLNIIQARWIDEENKAQLVAKGTYNFLFNNGQSKDDSFIVRADFSFIFNNDHPPVIFLQHSSLQVKERL
jgi:hypothetical protein